MQQTDFRSCLWAGGAETSPWRVALGYPIPFVGSTVDPLGVVFGSVV